MSGAGSFAGLSVLSFVHFGLTGSAEATMMIGSFGATTFLLFAAPKAPFAQPRNVVGGHAISAAIGSSVAAVALPPWLAAPTAVSLSTMAMLASRTVPPAVPLCCTELSSPASPIHLLEAPRWWQY